MERPNPLIRLPVLLLGLLLTGCATTNRPSIYIPPSDSKIRTFEAPPAAVIRLPVTFSMPHWGSLAQLPGWNDLSKTITDFFNSEFKTVKRTLNFPILKMGLEPSFGEISKFWDSAQEPIFIDKGIWLLIQPQSISTGLTLPDPKRPFKFRADLEMTAYPILVFGKKPTIEKKIMPPLKIYKPGPAGFHAVSNTVISFKEANKQLEDPRFGLIDRVIPGSGDYKLRIKGIKLFGSGGQVIAEVKIQYNPFINLGYKPARMTVYFRGVPQYDSQKELFTLRNLDFDLKTGDFLMQVANWIFKSDILKVLRQKARIPIGPKLDQLKGRMNEVLNLPVGKHSRLQTQVQSFRVLDAFVDKDGIRAQVSLDGDAQLNLFCR